jgi:IS30 family transposase
LKSIIQDNSEFLPAYKSLAELQMRQRKTMTFGNGKEFAGFKELEKSVGFCCYFADPYSSYQRGTNENTNGLLRQFFPKGTDFNEFSEEEIDKAAALINNRPRKCLNYRTPHEVLWSG